MSDSPLPSATYFCPLDGSRADVTAPGWCCPVCAGPWDLDTGAARPVGLGSLSGRVNSLWRYEEALPLSGPAVSLGEGRTPLVPLTERVSAKLDFLMPTLSFKDRGAVMLAELARRLSPERVVADSSGNAGTAVAAYCARAGLPCTVYVPEGTSPKKTEQIRAHGARLVTVPGGREATASAARAAADAPGTFYASHVFNPFFLHGTKTYVYEIWEDLGGTLPEAIAVPVGNGTLLLGAALATAELLSHGLIDRRPALIAVQAEAASPLAAAFRAGDDGLSGPPERTRPTLAEGIAIPRPPRARQILSAVRESGGTFLTVTEDQIRAAQRDLAARGFFVETTGVACWAAVGGETDRSVVVPLCGAGLKTGLAP
ncbi:MULTISPECIES: threonine synthase [unclassified Streptomyces]|uniref:threonine synthase n=1 Tax=unclassified Streptomyces TaxID=2593676 RepID=UPI0011C88195|nr:MULTISPECIES: threonine synthase [unclassified Streptomyces]WSQ77779.1 threonine synthase [Streptomyces sp. NBC_01213]TXS19058.1 pyridoxal-phosphate dependent enzyme [Streptomyces sp. wa22]WSQ85149.1 threonine synthase [Streptomyces sp. NBC_01212]WSR08776.1 threonine synthase [Streptomyces sp. NBC_01208]WSR48492.1 threonine synthase [Streptomyces sp. NBC_01201]